MDIEVKRKQLLFIASCCCVFAGCTFTGNNESGSAIDANKNDTASYFGDELITRLPPGFIMDTIRKPDTGNSYHETVVVPRFSGASFRELDGILQKEIILLTDTDISSGEEAMANADTMEEDTSETNVNVSPLTIYQTPGLVSYGFLKIMFSKGMMRPYRSYFAVNYDKQQNRFISFSHYFNLPDKKDTVFLQWIIYGKVGIMEFPFYKLGDHISFSSDKENVYFYFDQFGFVGNAFGIVKGVKKKYIQQFIKDEYR
jgi:hypothetical protein